MKKRIEFITCVFLVVVLMTASACHHTSYPTESGVSNKSTMDAVVDQHKDALILGFLEHRELFQSIASEALASTSTPIYYYYETKHSNLNDTLKQKIELLPDTCNIDFSCVYTDIGTSQIYPKDACVFRCSVFDGDTLYCWVDLVHSENWDFQLMAPASQEMVEEGILTEIVSGWCVVILYGF